MHTDVGSVLTIVASCTDLCGQTNYQERVLGRTSVGVEGF